MTVAKREIGYFLNLGIATTRFMSSLIGSDYRVSLSTQSYYWKKKGRWKGRVLVGFIDFLCWVLIREERHCHNAYQNHLRHQTKPTILDTEP